MMKKNIEVSASCDIKKLFVLIAVAIILMVVLFEAALADPGKYRVTIKSGSHTIKATSCVFSQDSQWEPFNFDPPFDMNPSQQDSRVSGNIPFVPNDFILSIGINCAFLSVRS